MAVKDLTARSILDLDRRCAVDQADFEPITVQVVTYALRSLRTSTLQLVLLGLSPAQFWFSLVYAATLTQTQNL